MVIQVFTEKFGIQGYLVHGVRKAKAKIGAHLLQPMHLLDMVVYHKEGAGLNRVSELRQIPVFQRIPYDIAKSSMVLFLNEMLYRSIRPQGPDAGLFEFIFNAICWLDSNEETPSNFHLFFLLRLTRYLGFYPAAPEKAEAYFDLKEGVFTTYAPGHTLILQEPHTSQWAGLLVCKLEELSLVRISTTDRRMLLQKMVDFYRLHLETIGEIKSLSILQEILA